MWRKALIAVALLAVVAIGLWLWRVMAIDSCIDNGGIWDVNNSRCVCTLDELVAPSNKDFATYCKAVPAP
jgi:hypothetical protein